MRKPPTGAKNTGHENTRRFARIFLQPSSRPLQMILGAHATWPTGERLDVLDLSYSGAAFALSPRISTQVGHIVELLMSLAGQPDVKVEAEVVRLTDRIMAVQFARLSTQARMALGAFLQEKLVGLHMRPVDPKYFARPGAFTHWFHGPNNSNVFLWYESGELKRATVELGHQLLEWENAHFSEGESSQHLESEGDDYVQPLLARRRAGTDVTGMSPLMARVLEVLTQIDDPDKVLGPLLQALLERKR